MHAILLNVRPLTAVNLSLLCREVGVAVESTMINDLFSLRVGVRGLVEGHRKRARELIKRLSRGSLLGRPLSICNIAVSHKE